MEARRKQASDAVRGDHYHTIANPAKGEKAGERGAEPLKNKGYRPGRKSARRQVKKRERKGGGTDPRPSPTVGRPSNASGSSRTM